MQKRLRSSSQSVLLGIVLVSCSGLTDEPGVEPGPPVVRIPFVLTRADNIAIRATLNGTDSVDLMFHTGVDSVSLTTSAIARLSSFTANGEVDVRSWGGKTKARQSTNNTLQIGAQTWGKVHITECVESGEETDGKFGPALFGGKVIEIDFEGRELRLHEQVPPLSQDFHRLELDDRNGRLSFPGVLGVSGREIEALFMLHTGFSGTALIDEGFLRLEGLEASLETISEGALKDSYGNDVRTRKVRLPALRIGAATFHDLDVGTFEGALGSTRTSILGCGLLKRFHIVLDAPHRSLYLRRAP